MTDKRQAWPSHWRHGLLAIALVAVIASAGCAASAPPNPQESEATMTETLSPEDFTAAQTRLEELMPVLQTEAGAFVELQLNQLREDSCLRPEDEQPQTKTRWTGQLAGLPADPETANAALDAVKAFLTAEGWELDPDEALSDDQVGTVRELYFQKDGLNVTARHERAELVPDTVMLLAATDCVEHPADHQMLRSPLDPEYGNSSQYYPDGA